MTCEIAIMNRKAVVLAADSAATVTGWVNGKEERRYFKGENKIFQLSDFHPVGLMTFGDADLQQVPWELLVKNFRHHLESKSFNKLNEYATEFFDFANQQREMFSNDERNEFFLRKVAEITIRFIIEGSQMNDINTASDEIQKKHAYDSFLLQKLSEIDAKPSSIYFSNDEMKHVTSTFADDASNRINLMLENIHHNQLVESHSLTELAIKSLIKEPHEFMGNTGIVVAGYGDHDYFPSLNEYRCYGILLDKIIHKDINSYAVDRERVAQIVPFASTAMVDTFTTGISPDAFSHCLNAFDKQTSKLVAIIIKESKLSDVPNIMSHLDDIRQEFTKQWYEPCLEAHYTPLRRVVAMLPLDEMAELGETLINLESLKEKVTQPTQSIGGPVDVAIISKSDGFIWVKRKHYFRADLNPRFFARKYKQ